MEIRITPHAIIREIKTVQPKVTELKIYNAKTWKYSETEQGLAIPITRTTTIMGVDGSTSYCGNIVEVNDRPVRFDFWSMPLN
jgi:hypothetical protein